VGICVTDEVGVPGSGQVRITVFKFARIVVIVTVAAVVVQSLPDIARYIRMRNM
jgi:hypothetical protein